MWAKESRIFWYSTTLDSTVSGVLLVPGQMDAWMDGLRDTRITDGRSDG